MSNITLGTDPVLARRLLQVGSAFHLAGPFFSYEEISQGNVNQTYKVNYILDDGTGMASIKPYLVQKVNTYVFKNPILLMENIDAVTEFIRARNPGEVNLHFHHTDVSGERKTYLLDGDSFWRVCNYVPSVTFDSCDDLRIVRSAGEAFGNFQRLLSDFDASKLFYTIPDFHNTRKRYQNLKETVRNDPTGRAKEVQEELDYLLEVEDTACRLTDLYDDGKLPLRVTHNDTKINNVLFDPDTRKAIVVIDLDTVMPGLVGHDFGDAIRFAANFTEEDSRETEKSGLDLNVFWTFTEGFLSRTADMLTDLEVETLGISSFAMTVEVATRFLEDYIAGDKYFRIKSPDHNLVRTRCQIALSKDMLAKMDAMDAIIEQSAKKYKK